MLMVKVTSEQMTMTMVPTVVMMVMILADMALVHKDSWDLVARLTNEITILILTYNPN